MALNLDLLMKTFGANSPEYITLYASENGLSYAQAEANIANDDSLLPAYLERYGRKWTISQKYWDYHHVQKRYGETNNNSQYDNRVIVYDHDGVLCNISESQSTQILKRIARALREYDIATYGVGNIVVL
jgi:hypothetical protein